MSEIDWDWDDEFDWVNEDLSDNNPTVELVAANAAYGVMQESYADNRKWAIILGTGALAAATGLGLSIEELDLKSQPLERLVIAGESIAFFGLALETLIRTARARSFRDGANRALRTIKRISPLDGKS